MYIPPRHRRSNASNSDYVQQDHGASPTFPDRCCKFENQRVRCVWRAEVEVAALGLQRYNCGNHTVACLRVQLFLSTPLSLAPVPFFKSPLRAGKLHKHIVVNSSRGPRRERGDNFLSSRLLCCCCCCSKEELLLIVELPQRRPMASAPLRPRWAETDPGHG